MVAIYAARALEKGGWLAKAALSGIFGAAQVAGKPLRFHLEDFRGRAAAAARMIGAADFLHLLDGDGVPQGVFDGV